MGGDHPAEYPDIEAVVVIVYTAPVHSRAGWLSGGSMDTTTLLIIVVVLVLLGGGWYGRGRWY